jgi:cytochrome c oxidase subunit 2
VSELDKPSSGENSDNGDGAASTPDLNAALSAELTADAIHVDRYEGAWIRISMIVLVIFFVTIVFSAFAFGFQVPGVYQRIDPATLNNPDSPFANPALRELAPGKYEVYIRAQVWNFTPNEIHVPVGSTVRFYATSQDVVHGVIIAGTNVNMMILPGQITTLSANFNHAGTFNFMCHEYCGLMHHTMYGKIVVDSEVTPASETSQVNPLLLRLGQ